MARPRDPVDQAAYETGFRAALVGRTRTQNPNPTTDTLTTSATFNRKRRIAWFDGFDAATNTQDPPSPQKGKPCQRHQTPPK